MNRSIRVLVTERCNANCKNCFNKDVRTNQEMEVSDFERLCQYLSSHCSINVLKIMGGEPTVHSEFGRIVNVAQQYFDAIAIFTNAINDKIKNIQLRDSDKVIYNLECIGLDFEISKLLINQKGYRILEVQISHDSNIELIKKKISYLANNLGNKQFHISLTLNCMENIFSYKEELKTKWDDILDFLREKGISRFVDHNIPICFQRFSGINTYKTSMCMKDCAGLITVDFKLRYCNQNPVDLGMFYDAKDGKYMSYEDMMFKIGEAYSSKLLNNSDKICSGCPYWKKVCNGGCFMHKPFITRESVIKSMV